MKTLSEAILAIRKGGCTPEEIQCPYCNGVMDIGDSPQEEYLDDNSFKRRETYTCSKCGGGAEIEHIYTIEKVDAEFLGLPNREFYMVEDVNGEKAIHYMGRAFAGSESATGYAATEFNFCYEPVPAEADDGLHNRIVERSKDADKFSIEFSDAERMNHYTSTFFFGQPGTRLDFDEVDQNTPYGYYWCPFSV